ncbi:helix-turn-helix domain-containing protein [Streptomyces sp. A1-5]|uniref:helix-turn-helix domain-containing protein n=1 Tax=Streptomyces sp. A1-5 TaxID=2738410 RepID=UPI001F330082|nr:helix-turn-helix domain-containing protein [Streptomyces sp. A1-5]UJB46051.1 helix-turn-helix transcriptional regulator [Streptomyces sp. A1-5]
MTTRRAELLAATCRVIALRGGRGLRVEDVAAEAGVSRTLIYYHFRDRAGLVASALEYVNDRAEGYVAGADEGSVPASVDSRAAAVRLTSLVEGLSGRWLAGLLTTAEARAHVAAALERELAEGPQG